MHPHPIGRKPAIGWQIDPPAPAIEKTFCVVPTQTQKKDKLKGYVPFSHNVLGRYSIMELVTVG